MNSLCSHTEKASGYHILKGGIKPDTLSSFLISLLNDSPDIENNLVDWIFYMDNASIHKVSALRPFLKYIRMLKFLWYLEALLLKRIHTDETNIYDN